MVRFLLLSLLSLAACSGPSNENTESVPDQPFFPVLDFLKGEQRLVDSLPVGLQQIRRQAGMSDTSFISLEEFHRLTDPFLSEELRPDRFQESFREQSFFDQGTKTANFLYLPKDGSTFIKRVDITTKKRGVYDRVISLYMEREESVTGESYTKKLLWRPGKRFQLINSSSTPSGDYELQVIWDNIEEGE